MAATQRTKIRAMPSLRGFSDPFGLPVQVLEELSDRESEQRSDHYRPILAAMGFTRGKVKSSARAGIQKVLEHSERSMELGPRCHSSPKGGRMNAFERRG